jgi:GMP synthase (glutamine-hydrolysing)
MIHASPGREVFRLVRRTMGRRLGLRPTDVRVKALRLAAMLLLCGALLCPAWLAVSRAEGEAEEGVDVLIVNLNRSPDVHAGADEIAQVMGQLRPGLKTRVVHYRTVDLDFINGMHPRAVVLSPQQDPWWTYSEEELKRLSEVVRGMTVPILGICGGHQFLALAFGGKVAPIKGEPGPDGYTGLLREKGLVQVVLVARSPLLGRRAVGDKLLVVENHVEEVKEVPAEFGLVATGEVCRVQFMQHRSRPIHGVQFHPERTDDKSADGIEILKGFLKLALEGDDGRI